MHHAVATRDPPNMALDYKLPMYNYDIHNKRFPGLEIGNRKGAFMSFKQFLSFWVNLIVLPYHLLLTIRN
jgi:hypothetical protein